MLFSQGCSSVLRLFNSAEGCKKNVSSKITEHKKNKPSFNRIIQCLDDLRAPMIEKKEVKKTQQKLGNKHKTLFLWCFL